MKPKPIQASDAMHGVGVGIGIVINGDGVHLGAAGWVHTKDGAYGGTAGVDPRDGSVAAVDFTPPAKPTPEGAEAPSGKTDEGLGDWVIRMLSAALGLSPPPKTKQRSDW